MPALRRDSVATLQINVGKRCNQACHHCHVDAGPKRTEELQAHTAHRLMSLMDDPQIETIDITGGAPELNAHFRTLVSRARSLGKQVIDRCNLTILFEPSMEDLAEFLAANEVHVVASLPCYSAGNVDKQRGRGVFDKSIEALRRLNALGYGEHGSPLQLDLVYNPQGPSLPPAQDKLEARYKLELAEHFDVSFGRLLTITNMPISRFAHTLERTGQYEAYMSLLVNHFNPDTVPALMCRSLVSVGWDGRVYDCDFNQMLELPAADRDARTPTLFEIDSLSDFVGARIAVADHCLGCTAGAGSSCGGALG
ncbi:MAG: arsenosugar biosynthesis radical SAM protein ArsS [Deltaproteobacteria bacterium]|nr:arsenosugar biosynthesis radical SAM protein ArsS [Deltaproteobacteria bacterium]